MADYPHTPPPSGPQTPNLPPLKDASLRSTTPQSINTPITRARPTIPGYLTQALVLSNPQLRRLQQDLLVLTSFNENSTLHWRPPWFAQDLHAARFWTLYNPPNVVTELLPHAPLGQLVYTRRMRRAGDMPPAYITTWKHWNRVCDSAGVPRDWLNEEYVELMKLGLPRDEGRDICAPPSIPMYPEPQPLDRGRYILDPATYRSLPRKFHLPDYTDEPIEDVQVVVVHSSGRLAIEPREDFFLHSSQWTHFDGHGGYALDGGYVPDLEAPKEQGKGRRWCWVPWTGEMETSCRLVVKLRGWNSATLPRKGGGE
ncbi:hypothetical protein HBI81_056180 [Parastagonospora nodorum]|nr:hypothetical protein HBI81_056180 [Parastagonospora nodorum]